MGKGRAPCCDKSKVKRGPWSPAEDLRLITFIQKNGHHNWRSLPRQAGLLRCGKSCRLRWINYLRPDVKRGNFTKEEEDTIIRLHQTLGNKWSKIASYLPGRTDNEIKNVWHTNLKKKLDEKNYKDNQSNKGSPLDSSSSLSSSTTQFSHGQTNSELDHHHHHHQMDHHDDGHNHHHTMPKNPSDEDPLSSSELLEVELSKQFDSLEEVDKPDMIVLPSVASPICNHLEEVNKPDMIISSSVGDHQTPLESDLEFWNRLDGIEAFFSNDEVDELLNGMGSDQSPNFQSHVHNNNKNKNFEEVDSNNWLKYLEHELGLEDTGGDEILINKENPQPLIPSESCNDQIMRIPTEVDNMGMGYFHHQQLIPPESCDQIMDNIPIEVDMGMGYFHHHHHHHHHHAWPSYQSPRHSSVF